MTESLYYLLHFKQHHLLFGHVFGKHLEAEQHVRGGHRVQGVGGQEHTLEAVLPHLKHIKTEISFASSVTRLDASVPLQQLRESFLTSASQRFSGLTRTLLEMDSRTSAVLEFSLLTLTKNCDAQNSFNGRD